MNSTKPNSFSDASTGPATPWENLPLDVANAKLEACKTLEEEVAVMMAHGCSRTAAMRALGAGRDLVNRDEVE